jgi:acetyl-CoA carboxylase biotin carboxylase subunit
MFYDPMIGKLIVWATTRQYAIERMRRALYEYKVTGLVTNIRYLRRIIDVPQFKEGNYDTSFIEVNQQRLRPRPGFKNDSEDMAIIASYIDYLMNYEENTDNTQDTSSALNRWRAFGLQKGVLRV